MACAEQITVDKLFKLAMKGEWDKVVEAYRVDADIRKAKITNSEDTALHIAVAAGKEDVVSIMVESIKSNELQILTMKNERGNTALHLAATSGNLEMCHDMASKTTSLVAVRNTDGETPLFLAARHGKMKAFICLINLSADEFDVSSSFRNNHGDTILHSALSGEDYKLAYHIVEKFPYLVNSVNENGQTPLHILASKPNAFYSSTRLRLFDRIIYSCVYVPELKMEAFDKEPYSRSVTRGQYAKNYEILNKCFAQRRNSIQAERRDSAADEESQKPNFEISRVMNLSKKKEKAHLVCISYVSQLMRQVLLYIVWCLGMGRIESITRKKKKHTRAKQVMNKLVEATSAYQYNDNGGKPRKTDISSIFSEKNEVFYPSNSEKNITHDVTDSSSTASQGQNRSEKSLLDSVHGGKKLKKSKRHQPDKKETAILVAARKGITEIVERILEEFPVAIHDMNSRKKNIVLLAVENRQTKIYDLLSRKRYELGETVFLHTDEKGNSALHLAANCGRRQPWLIPGGALQMQWEIKWYKFVKKSMPTNFFVRHNKKNETPKDIFTKTHKNLANEGREWLTKTSEACSVVAALIATVAFGASTTVPGGFDANNGRPILKDEVVFNVFAISSLVALCFSVTALIFFLTILTSRYQHKDFAYSLPRKLLLGLTCLFTSIAAILISFCSGHSFVLKEKLRFATYPIYLATCLPMTYFALEQVPLYFDLIQALFKEVPQRSYKSLPH